MPLILLPGRRFEITRTLKLPSKAVIYAQGQAFIAAKDQTFDLIGAQGGVNLTFSGIGLSGGRHPLVVEGSGNVLFDNGRIYDTTGGFLLKRLGDKPLRVSVQASTLITPVLAENYGAEFDVLSCWFELGPMLNRAAGVRNYQGIIQFSAVKIFKNFFLCTFFQVITSGRIKSELSCILLPRFHSQWILSRFCIGGKCCCRNQHHTNDH